ncbi:hypothetical protein E2C01_028396 [Portunus trituberculatus]|uniref:Uncharacterized protein n=1 Tax=Portunus trituberculatus TaxID=210409 RepID=A0A5B7EPC7_PORTR|nr:hypothetical protein [Portunus trituberculatus]
MFIKFRVLMTPSNLLLLNLCLTDLGICVLGGFPFSGVSSLAGRIRPVFLLAIQRLRVEFDLYGIAPVQDAGTYPVRQIPHLIYVVHQRALDVRWCLTSARSSSP